MSRRILLPIVLVAAVGVAAAVAATQVRWNGGLGHGYGNWAGLPVRVGAPFTIGMTDLSPADRVRIEAVRLHRPSPHLVLVSAIVYPAARAALIGSAATFAPHVGRVRMRPAEGAVIRAGAKALLAVGLRTTSAGSFRLQGVDVLYRESWHGIDIHRKAHVGLEVTACAVRTSARIVRCTVPRPGS